MNMHLNTIDDAINQRHLLKHPFYLAWTRGELSREALTDYARQYYHHVAAFPTYLSAVHSKCDDQPTRRKLLDNLIEEEAGSPNHPELWSRFANALGIEDVDLARTEKQPETRDLIDTFRSICGERSTEEGLAALYAYESQIPAICEAKIDGLKKYYGFDRSTDYEYFTVHIEADRKHSTVEREALSAKVHDGNIGNVSASVTRVLGALWGTLSGVCRRHAIAA